MLQPDLDLCRVLALQAVRYNKWSPDDGIIKTMFYCCCQMIDGIMPAARIKCIRIRDKRFCPGCPDLFYNLPYKDRIYVSIVPILSKMNLYCSQVV